MQNLANANVETMAPTESVEEAPANDAFLDEATRFLMKEGSAGGPTLHDHLTQVLLKLIVERPVNANSQFENISLSLRQLPASVLEKAAEDAILSQTQAVGEEAKEDADKTVKKTKTVTEVASEAVAAWCLSHKHLFPNPPIPEPEEDEAEEVEAEPEDPQLPGPVAPILDDAFLWKQAGVGFGEEQTFRLFRSLQIMSGRESEGGECTMQFWGKVFSRAGAYFIAYALTEQTASPDPLEVNEETEEKDGFRLTGIKEFDAEGLDGPNKYTYWASLDPSGDKAAWVKLPHVTCEQIRVARHHRRFLTGDLSSPVPCFPPLPGNTEAHLLRAVIADITSDTHLNLAGLMEADDDAGSEEPPVMRVKPMEEEDEETMKTFTLAEMKMPEAWVHSEIDIKANGRCQMKPPPEEDEGAEEKDLDMKRLEFFSNKPSEEEDGDSDTKAVLRSISEDVDINGKNEWVVRSAPNAAAATNNTTVVAKSLKWPGAVSIACGFQAPIKTTDKPRRRCVNIYVGFGVPSKAAGKRHTPKHPSKVCVEQDMMPLEQEDVLVAPPEPVEEE